MLGSGAALGVLEDAMRTALAAAGARLLQAVLAGGCKAIVVQRTKQPGMHWTVSGAADIIALRCQHASGRWDELWPAGAARPPGLQPAI